MLQSKSFLAVDFGAGSLKLAEFEVNEAGGLRLKQYGIKSLGQEGAQENTREATILKALQEMIASKGFKSKDCNVCAPGFHVFSKFVKLPPVEQSKVTQIIHFEAQQNVPFPIDEVVWDYQLVGSDAAEKIEVVLVAIKADLLEGINAAVEGSGLQTTLVDVATMALYNAFRFNYSELCGCSLVIDIGARTTNLLFVEPGKVFSRSIPIGGSSITSALAKEFNEPFAAAELRKKEDGFVSLGGAYAEASNPEVARVSKLVRNTMTRLHAEVARSISFYRTQQQGSQPERVFLCGGTVTTPYMREFFHEKLQWPVEFFNPLRNVTVGHAVPVEEVSHAAHLLGELVGLALRRTMTCPMELNLRPASVVRRQQLERRQPFFLLAAACFILALLAWGFYFARAAGVQTGVVDRLQGEVDRMHQVETQLNRLRGEAGTLDEAATPLLAAISDRGAWVRILDDLNARLPQENIWITELAPTSAGKILGEQGASGSGAAGSSPAGVNAPGSRGKPGTKSVPMIDGVFVRGLYLSNPKQQEIVVDYFRNLLGSSVFEVKPNQQAEVIRPSTPTTTEWAYPYELRLKLRQPFALP